MKVGPPAREREAWEVGGSRAGRGVFCLRLYRPGEQVSLFIGLRWGRGFCWVPGDSVLGFVLLPFQGSFSEGSGPPWVSLLKT